MAGILPYTRINPFTGNQGIDDVWVMISQERGGHDKGTWDMFSGKIDKGETFKEAAIREGAEESCELFGTADQIAKKIFPLNTSKSTFLLKAEELKTIPEITTECTNAAYLKRKKWTKFKSGCYQEKTAVKWVKLADLIDACVKNDRILAQNDEVMEIRPYFSKQIVKNQHYLAERLINKQKDRIKV
jgi:ADP-ribose pyrophosphatase YjhB (NUDIX family)